MKIFRCLRLQHALLALALVSAVRANAQDNTGNKPEMAAPAASSAPSSSMPGSSMAGQMETGHAPKTPSTTLTLVLKPASQTPLPAAGGTILLGDKTLTLTPADVAALPHENISVLNGHTKTSETYSGVPISAILARLGLPFEKKNEHTLLKTYLIAEGTDGYKVLVSTYETLGTIRDADAIVADAIVTPDGVKPLATDGVFKLVIPGDKRPQRWVQNLKSLTFKTIE
jgi:hypothetical protein